MNDSIEVDLSVFDHESLLDNLETSTNQSIVSFLPCHSTPLPEIMTQNSIASQLIPSKEKEDLYLFKPIKREEEVMEESSCDVSQEESMQAEEQHLNGISLSCVDNLNKEETLNNKSKNKVKEDTPCDKIVFKKPLYVKSIERCYQGLKQNKERFPAKNRNYKCDLCWKQFTTFKSISFHDQLEHKSILESRGVTCNECAQVFLDKTRLKTHILMEHSTRSLDYQCTICFRCYVSKQSLNSHMTSHSDKNKCENCSKRFTSASLLSVHIDRFHRKVKNHSCNTCNKLFYTRAEVNRHQRTVHLKIKGFRCHQCNLEFISRSALANHTRSVHSDEKAIVCDQCGERFKTQSQRWYHFKKMHDEYVTLFSCPLCTEMFSTKMGYRIHVKTHRTPEDIICFHCNRSFACKRNLRQHIDRIHRKPNQTCDLCGQIFLSRHKCLALNLNTSIVKDRERPGRNKYALAQSQHRKRYQSMIEKILKSDDIDFLKTDGKNWNCERCENIYTKKSNLKRHMMKKHGLAVKKIKLDDSVDTLEEIIESQVKERPNLVDTSEPHVDTQEHRVDTQEPQDNTQQNRVDTREHQVDTQEFKVLGYQPNVLGPIDTQEPRVDTQELRVDTQEPRVDTHEPRVGTQEPRVDTQEPRVDTQEPRVDTQESRVESLENLELPRTKLILKNLEVVEIINTTGSPLIKIYTER